MSQTKPVEVAIRVAGNSADEAAVQRVIRALRHALKLQGIEQLVHGTIVFELTESVGQHDAGRVLERPSPTGSPDPDATPAPPEDRMRLAKEQYPRAYLAWDEAEDERLCELHSQGCSPKVIAGKLQRQPGAIRSRLGKLGLG